MSSSSPDSIQIIMGRTLESKKQIVETIEGLLDNSDMALVLDY